MRKRFGVKSLCVFGSVAPDDAGDASDVDVLVEFQGDTTFDGYFGLKEALEGVLGAKVDLATPLNQLTKEPLSDPGPRLKFLSAARRLRPFPFPLGPSVSSSPIGVEAAYDRARGRIRRRGAGSSRTAPGEPGAVEVSS